MPVLGQDEAVVRIVSGAPDSATLDEPRFLQSAERTNQRSKAIVPVPVPRLPRPAEEQPAKVVGISWVTRRRSSGAAHKDSLDQVLIAAVNVVKIDGIGDRVVGILRVVGHGTLH